MSLPKLPKVFTASSLLNELNSDETIISRNGLYQLLDSGELRGFKVGSEWRIAEPAVLEWMGLDAENDGEADAPTAALEFIDHDPAEVVNLHG